MNQVYLLFASSYPGACFASLDHAMQWAASRRVAGVLLEFPLEVELVERPESPTIDRLPDAAFYTQPALRRNITRATAHWFLNGDDAECDCAEPLPAPAMRGQIWVFVRSRRNHDEPRNAADIDIIFSSHAKAAEWLREHPTGGVLTAYPVGGGVLELVAMQGNERAKRCIATMSAQEQVAESHTVDHTHYAGLVDGNLS